MITKLIIPVITLLLFLPISSTTFAEDNTVINLKIQKNNNAIKVIRINPQKQGIVTTDRIYTDEAKKEKSESELQLEDGIIDKYFKIWKKLFQSKSDISVSAFEKHISFRRVFNHPFLKDSRDQMSVEYFVTIEWFKSLEVNTFPIMLSPATDGYRYLNVSRGTYLSEDEINLILSQSNFRDIGKVNINEPLFYSSQKEAIINLHKILGEAKFSDDRISYSIFKGEPLMYVIGLIEDGNNRCRRGSVNLINGASEIDEMPCRIF